MIGKLKPRAAGSSTNFLAQYCDLNCPVQLSENLGSSVVRCSVVRCSVVQWGEVHCCVVWRGVVRCSEV